ncbi:MAG: NAD(P)-dependent oxidoreductase [Rikenellaceae bacterium]
MKKVIVSHNLFREGFAELEKHFEVIYPEGSGFTFEQVKPLLKDAYAIIPTFAFKVTKDVIDAAPNLKIVANYGVGYDNIDWKYAASRGVVVTNSPDPVTQPTAELAYTMMLSLARRVAECDRLYRANEIVHGVMNNLGRTLYGKTLGIVGMGNIGRAVARYAKGGDMKIIYYNRKRLDESIEQELGATYVSFEELLEQSDVVSIHAPMTASTRHLFSTAQFEAMKQSALLINTARGPIVDEKALIESLKKGDIAGAALDVFEFEPDLNQEFLNLSNVIVTPHIGTATVDARNAMSAFASNNVIKFSRGESDITRVN